MTSLSCTLVCCWQVNCWPLLLLSGSSPAADRGKGDFQELDQVALMKPFTKAAGEEWERWYACR